MLSLGSPGKLQGSSGVPLPAAPNVLMNSPVQRQYHHPGGYTGAAQAADGHGGLYTAAQQQLQLHNLQELNALSLAVFAKRKYHLLSLSLLLAAGQLFVGVWNAGLRVGFGSFLSVFVVVSLAFICYVCTICELMSALPFAGGSYALARCTLGFFPGYIVGCVQTSLYVGLQAIINIEIVNRVDSATGNTLQTAALVLICLGIVFVQMFVCACEKIYWHQTVVLCGLALLLIIFICVFGLVHTDFDKFALSSHGSSVDYFNATSLLSPSVDQDSNHRRLSVFQGSAMDILDAFSPCLFFYIGVEVMCFSADEVFNARKQVPVAQFRAVIGVFLCTLFVVCIAVSSYPGIAVLSGEGFTANFVGAHQTSFFLSSIVNSTNTTHHTSGIAQSQVQAAEYFTDTVLVTNVTTGAVTTIHIFKGGVNTLATSMAHMFDLPVPAATLLPIFVLYGASCVCIYAYGKLTSALADSRLFPRFLKRNYFNGRVPLNAILLGGLLSTCVTVLCICVERTSLHKNVHVTEQQAGSLPVSNSHNNMTREALVECICLFACITMCAQLLGFLLIRLKMPSLPRAFQCPGGCYSATFAFCVFGGCLVMHIVMAHDNTFRGIPLTPTVMGSYLGFLSLYYYCVGNKKQRFSQAEKVLMMPAHVEIKNANGRSIVFQSTTNLCLILVCLHRLFADPLQLAAVCDRVFVPQRDAPARGQDHAAAQALVPAQDE
jgi:amino acid transporter